MAAAPTTASRSTSFPYVAAPWDGYAGGKARKACSGK